MPSLTDLPTELLEDVLAPLSVVQQSKLSRTCKALHSYLSPRIYHTVDWFWWDDGPCPPFDLLLRTLLSNTRLANLVKVLKLRGGGLVKHAEWKDNRFGSCVYTTGDENGWRSVQAARSVWKTYYQDNETSFGELDWRNVEKMIGNIHRPRPSLWIEEAKRGSIDVVVSLLVGCMETVEQLDIGFGYMHRAVFLPSMLRHKAIAERDNFPYPSLRTVDLGLDVPTLSGLFWSDIDFTRPWFFLPNVQSISMVLAEPVYFAWPSPTLTPNFVTLTKLSLWKSSACEGTLSRILASTPQLEHLVYDHCRMVNCGMPNWECSPRYCQRSLYPHYNSSCPRCAGGGGDLKDWCFLSCRILSEALSHIRSTLKSLTLRLRFETDEYTEITDPYYGGMHAGNLVGVSGRLIGLKDMSKLTSLEIPWVLLFGWEADTPEAYLWPLGDQAKLQFQQGVADLSEYQWSDVLPGSIEVLRLRHDFNNFRHYQYSVRAIVALTKQLLGEKEECFKALRCLSLLLMRHLSYEYAYKDWPTESDALHRLCSEIGIIYDIVRDAPPLRYEEQ